MITIKKIIGIIVLTMTLLAMITGCSDTKDSSPKAEESEYKNLVVSDVKYDKPTKIISYNISNNGKESLYTGVGYTIEKYEDKNGWVKTDLTDNLAFIEIAIIIERNKFYQDKIDLSQIDPLKEGYYRIVKNYTGEKNYITQYIQFEVSDDDLSNFISYNKLKDN